METRNDFLETETMDLIQPFSGTPEEMSVEQKMLMEGMPLQKVQTSYVTAISVQKPRSITRITNNVLAEARLAGAAFYYGWTAKGKTGPAKIEGPSIDLAMCLVRNYGNSAIELEATETLTHYMLKACFVDLESGVTLPRIFRQRKSQKMGDKMDVDRQEDIVFQIGQSKAIRNTIVRAMPNWLIDQAIEVAKESELAKIKPENMALSREKALSFFKPYGITLERMEAKIGRKADDWTAQDIVDLRANAVAVKEGRVRADDLFPGLDSDSYIEPYRKAVTEVGAPPPGPTVDDEFRAEFINLRSAGFSTWVHTNLDRIVRAPSEIQKELNVKWSKLYSEPFPVNPGSTHEVDEATGEVMPSDDEFDKEMASYEELLKPTAYFKVLMVRGYKDETEVPQEEQDEVLAAMSSELDAQNSS